MLSPSNVKYELKQGCKSQKATSPYAWQYTVAVEDADRFTAAFTKCGIYEYLKSRGMAEIVPAMCALDNMTEARTCAQRNHYQEKDIIP